MESQVEEVRDSLFPARELLRAQQERERNEQWQEEHQRLHEQLLNLRNSGFSANAPLPRPGGDSFSASAPPGFNDPLQQGSFPSENPHLAHQNSLSFQNLSRPTGAMPVPPPNTQSQSFQGANQFPPQGASFHSTSNPLDSHPQQIPQFPVNFSTPGTEVSSFSVNPSLAGPPGEEDLAARMRRLSTSFNTPVQQTHSNVHSMNPTFGLTQSQPQTPYGSQGSFQQSPHGSFQGGPQGSFQGSMNPQMHSQSHYANSPQQGQPGGGMMQTTMTQEEYFRYMNGLAPPSYQSARDIHEQMQMQGANQPSSDLGPLVLVRDSQDQDENRRQSSYQNDDHDINPFEESLLNDFDKPDSANMTRLNRDDLLYHTDRVSYSRGKYKKNAAKVLIPLAAAGGGALAGAIGGTVVGAAVGGVGAPVGFVVGAILGGTTGASMGIAATSNMKSKSVVPYSGQQYGGNTRCCGCRLPFDTVTGVPFRCIGCNFVFCHSCGVSTEKGRRCEDCARALPSGGRQQTLQYY